MAKQKTKAELLGELEQAQKRIAELEKAVVINQAEPQHHQTENAEKALRLSEEKFQKAFMSSPDSIVISSMETGEYIDVNESFVQETGYGRDELIGKTSVELNVWVDSKDRDRMIKVLKSEGKIRNFETRYKRKNGEIRESTISAEIIEFEHGEKHLLSVIQDITERKRDRVELKRSEARFRALFESSQVVMLLIDPNTGEIVDANPAAQQFYGYPELIGMNINQINQLSPEEVEEKLEHAKENKENYFIFPHRLANGDIRTVEVGSNTIELNNHTILFSIIFDITERKKFQEQMAESEEILRLFVEHSPAAIAMFDCDMRYIVHSRRYVQDYRLDQQDLIGLSHYDVFPKMVEQQKAIHQRCLQGETIKYGPGKMERMDGSIDWVKWDLRPWYTADGAIGGVIFLSEVITEQKETQDKIQASEKKYRDLINSMNDTVWVIDSEFNIIDVNQTASEILGYSREEFLSMKVFELDASMNEAEIENLPNTIGEDEFLIFETAHKTKDGREVPVEISSSNITYMDQPMILSIARDISQRKEMENQIRVSEARYRSLVQSQSDIITRSDEHGKLTFVNDACCRLLDVPAEELLGHDLSKYILPEDWVDIYEIGTMLREQPLNFHIENRLMTKDGIRWYGWEISAVLDKDNHITELQGVGRDITERKLAEESAKYRQQLLEKVIQLGKRVSAITDLDTCLSAIHQSIQQDLKFDRVGLFLYNEEADTLNGTYGTNRDGERVTIFDQVSPAKDFTDWQLVTQSSGGLIFNQNFEEEYNLSEGDEMFGVKQHIAMAAWAGDHPIALIVADNLVSQREMPAADVEALQLFAGYAGLAIANAELHGGLEKRIRQRTAELEAIKQRLEIATKAAKLGVWEWDIQSNELIWDDQVYENYGVSKDSFEVSMEAFRQLIHPEERQKMIDFSDDVIATKDDCEAEFRSIRSNGDIGFNKVHCSIQRDNKRNPQSIIGVVQNITPEKLAENALRESELQNRLLFEETPEAIVLLDMNGEILRANHAYVSLTKIPLEEMVGKTDEELGLVSPEIRAELSNKMKKSLSQGKTILTVEHPLTCRDGSERIVESRMFYMELGGSRHYLITVRDISLQKQSEEIMRVANLELERALRMKDEFLANMSHELRTPLTAILGISESLIEQVVGPLNEHQMKYVKILSESGTHLLNLINDILDLAKINAGKIELEKTKISTASICESSIRMIRQMATKKSIHINFDMDENVKYVWGDMRRLKQMLVNLLSNAEKFTPPGGQIGLEVRGDIDNEVVTFTVWDTGIGIEEEDIENLFKPFMQVDSSLSRKAQGTGLGLAIVNRLAQLHGGSVSVKSTIGLGSRFTFSLPWADMQTGSLNQSEINESLPAQFEEGDAPLILVVEDVEGIQMLLKDNLQHHGYRVVSAANGSQGIKMAIEHEPDVILMDVMMPEMDGITATRQIRKHANLENTPIIALTALAMPEDRERFINAGMTDYLSKPVYFNDLLTLLQNLLEEPPSNPSNTFS